MQKNLAVISSLDSLMPNAMPSTQSTFDVPTISNSAWQITKLHFYYYDSGMRKNNIVGSNNLGRRQIRELRTVRFTLVNQTKLEVNQSQKHHFSYGFETYQNEQTGQSLFLGARIALPDAEALNYDLYVHDENTVLPQLSAGDKLTEKTASLGDINRELVPTSLTEKKAVNWV